MARQGQLLPKKNPIFIYIFMKKIILVACISTLFTGCASVMNESTHPMRIETKTADGQQVSGADCKLTNDYGSVSTKSGETITVRRSSKDLDISCTHAQSGEARGRAISRANSGMFGNILIGGGIGALIDHNKGTAYTYPTWVQMIFGKSKVFDRSDEKEGQPVLGLDVGAPTGTAGNTGAANK